MKCSKGFYFNSLRVCTKTPDTCQTFNEVAGRCEGCYNGYELNDEYECVVSVGQVSDPGCN